MHPNRFSNASWELLVLITSALCRALRVLHQGGIRRQEPDRQVEEAGLREPLLPALHPDAGHQFRDQLHLQGPQKQAGSGKFSASPCPPARSLSNLTLVGDSRGGNILPSGNFL